MTMVGDLTDVRKRRIGTSSGTVGLHLIGDGFASRGSVGCSFTLIGSEDGTRAVLNQSQYWKRP